MGEDRQVFGDGGLRIGGKWFGVRDHAGHYRDAGTDQIGQGADLPGTVSPEFDDGVTMCRPETGQAEWQAQKVVVVVIFEDCGCSRVGNIVTGKVGKDGCYGLGGGGLPGRACHGDDLRGKVCQMAARPGAQGEAHVIDRYESDATRT